MLFTSSVGYWFVNVNSKTKQNLCIKFVFRFPGLNINSKNRLFSSLFAKDNTFLINEECNAQQEEFMHGFYSIKLKFLDITELIFTNNSVTVPK